MRGVHENVTLSRSILQKKSQKRKKTRWKCLSRPRDLDGRKIGMICCHFRSRHHRKTACLKETHVISMSSGTHGRETEMRLLSPRFRTDREIPQKKVFLLVFSSLSKRLDKIAAKPGNGTLPLDSDDLLLTASTVTLHNSFFKTCHRVLLELSVFRLFRSFLFPSRARNWSVGFWFSCGYISLICWCNLLKKRWISTYNQWYWSKIADGQRHEKQKKLTFTNDD